MTPHELKAARRKLGLSVNGLAAVTKTKSERTVRRWEYGSADIPGAVQQLVRVLVACPQARAFLGIKSCP